MNECLFCKIVQGKIPSTKIYEDENVLGFKDLHPQAIIHQLFIHKKHTKDINDLSEHDPQQLAAIFHSIQVYTQTEHLANHGFRVVTNLGPHAGQTVFHTHFHVLAGGPLGHFGS